MCRFAEVEHFAFMQLKLNNFVIARSVLRTWSYECSVQGKRHSGHRRYSFLDLFVKELAFFTSEDLDHALFNIFELDRSVDAGLERSAKARINTKAPDGDFRPISTSRAVGKPAPSGGVLTQVTHQDARGFLHMEVEKVPGANTLE